MSTISKKPRVAFQGERGAFSEEAALKLLGPEIELVPRRTFADLYESLDSGIADYVLAPVENSIAGVVKPSVDLLNSKSLNILDEIQIKIEQHLIGCPGASFAEIQTVESHPVALDQCRRFLAANPQLRRLAAEDTAGSVARIVAEGDRTRSAIAGRRAAEQYGGVILRDHLEDSRENYTRFLLLTPEEHPADDADKMSLVIELPHQPGALHDALEPFARRDIDLLKLQGRPVKGRPWEYCFYLDLPGSPKDREVQAALKELRDRRVETRVLGAYRAAPVPLG